MGSPALQVDSLQVEQPGKLHVSTAALQQVQNYHLSRVHIYALIYGICFAPSDLLHPV